MRIADYCIDLMLSVFLIVGAYQFYFWCQRHPLTTPREWSSALDDRIPLQPKWVWIYSCLYYPAILYTNAMVRSPAEFTRLATTYLTLLMAQMAFFVVVPVMTPERWRSPDPGRSWSARLLALVQRFDARSNSFPSMHTSVAMLTALHLYPATGPWVLGFPVLIGLSCLFTKQHYLVDLPAGAVLGWLVFEGFRFVA